MGAAREIIDLTLSREPTLGAGRVIAVDGPSGSGKSTLVRALSANAADRGISHRVLPLDLLYAGWSGLAGIGATLDALLRPLATGAAGHAPTWDWDADRPGGDLVLEPVDLLVLDGVGAGHRTIADLLTVLVWLDGDSHTNLGRALARDVDLHESAGADPAAYRARLEQWQDAEAAHFAVDATRERADIALG